MLTIPIILNRDIEISVAILAIPHRFVKSSIEIFVIQAVQSGQTQKFFVERLDSRRAIAAAEG